MLPAFLERPLLRLDLDDRCNLKCDFCPTGIGGNVGRGSFSPEILAPLVQQLGNNIWAIYLSCSGEPLLNPRFEESLQAIAGASGSRDLTIITNATLLSETKAKAILRQPVSRIIFSIDSLRKERYEAIRKGANFDTMMKNVRRFSELKGSRTYPKIIISSILMDETEDEVEDFADFALEIGADCLRLQNLELIPETNPTEKPSSLPPALMRRMQKVCLKLFLKGIVFDFPFDFSAWKFFSVLQGIRLHRRKLDYCLYVLGRVIGKLGSHCSYVGLEAVAKRDGSVYPCTEIPCRPWDAASQTPGSQPELFGKSISSYLRAARRRFHKKPFSRCDSCRFYNR